MKIINKYSVFIIFSFFYLFLILQFSKVFIYYDDFGYLSLSYVPNTLNIVGTDYSFKNIIEFSLNAYLNSSGRITMAIVYCIIFKLGGLELMQIFMATCVFSITFCIYTILKKFYKLTETKSILLSLLICLLYGTISITMHRLGTYWFIAAYTYVIPCILFLLFSMLYFNTLSGKLKIKQLLILVLLSIIIGCAHEQWSATLIGFIIITIIYKKFIFKKINVSDFLILITSLCSFSIIILSPSTNLRMTNENNILFNNLPLLVKIKQNISIIFNIFFSKENMPYLYIILVAFLIMGIRMYINKQGKKMINFIHILYCFIIILFSLNTKENHIIGSNNLKLALFILFIIFMVLQTLYYLYLQQNFYIMCVFCASLVSIACLVLVPEIPVRTFLPFIFLSFLYIGSIFCEVLLKQNFILSTLICFGLCAISVPNMSFIYSGYRANFEIAIYNDYQLKRASKNISEGEPLNNITLYKADNILCGAELVYYENFSYMRSWINEYYYLPADLEFVFRE